MTGQTVSHYRVLEELGRGGMGVVYRAEDSRLGRQVALKFLTERAEQDGSAVIRFLREARAASAPNHPSICTVHDVGVHEGHHYIVMELLEGGTLKSRLASGPLSTEQIIEWAIQIADALDVAHEQGIIHRDIKPTNLFVTNRDRIKILDFGLAKLGGQRAPTDDDDETMPATVSPMDLEVTRPGSTIGTIAYMSPEQALGQVLDGRTDLFSFGVVLYRAVAGQLPFRGSGPEVLDALLTRAPTPLRQLNPEVPDELVHIIDKALEKDPDLRYQTAAEMRADLKRLRRDVESGSMETRTVKVSVGATQPGTGEGAPTRSPRQIAFVAISAVVVVVALIAALSRRTAPPPAQQGQRLALLVSSSGGISDPALSPDGKMLALVDRQRGRYDLFVSRVAGGDRVRLTDDSARESEPAFSPDGERLAFSRLRPIEVPAGEAPDTSTRELCVVPALGGEVATLATDANDPAWSADGSRLVFVQMVPGQPHQLVSIAADGSDPRTLLTADSTYPFLRRPSWSPDDRHVVVQRSSGGIAGDLWLVPLDGSPRRRLIDDAATVFSQAPVFTADGRGVVHSSNRAGATNLWLARLDGRPPVRLTTGPGPDQSPSVADDGSIAFINPRSRSVLLEHELQTGRQRELVSHAWFLWAPAYSPDGRSIAFSRAEVDGAWHTWLVERATGKTRQLTRGERGEVHPRFHPDGRSVLYFSWSRPRQIGSIPVAGGPPSALTTAAHDDSYGELSPHGERLVFVRTSDDSTRLYIADADGGNARALTDVPSTVPRWSPDGEWIAFSPDRGYASGVFLVRPDGSDLRRLTERGGWPTWWPDGSRIGFLSVGPDGNQQIRTVPITGGPSERLSGFDLVGVNYPFDVSPDGRHVAIANVVEFSADVWLLQAAVARGGERSAPR